MSRERTAEGEEAVVNESGGASRESDQAMLARLFNDTRKRLVETGTRNRLVHVNRASTRGNLINIVNERSDEVHTLLTGGASLRFLALGEDAEDTTETLRLAELPEPESSRYTDRQLETRLGPDALQKKLLKIAREARTAEEESGVNILYLALGFLTWFEDKSSRTAREAPLVLLPVELVRNARSSTFDLRLRDEEVLTNLPLQQRLKDDFGIALPDIDMDEDWAPSRYFALVRDIIAPREEWKVDTDAMQLGFFSFSKLLMFRDLALEAWPDGSLASHALTRGLLYEGFERVAPLFAEDARLDALLPPDRLFHVVDADASQTKVIEEVRAGRNLVVQGPPGTGKSQTITNIIAAAVKEGKRVLFVAEKMAALSVVHDRLVKVGLADVCLELHSRTANKKAVLSELARTITQAQAVPSLPGARTALQHTRDTLNALTELLHSPIDDRGETPFSVLGLQARCIGKGAPPPSLRAPELRALSRAQEKALLDSIEHYATLLQQEGGDAQPFAGVRNLELQPVELARLAQGLGKTQALIEALVAALDSARAALSVDAPTCLNSAAPLDQLLGCLEGLPSNAMDLARQMLAVDDLPRLRETLRAGQQWRAAFDSAEQRFVDLAFQNSAAPLRAPLVAGMGSFFTRWGSAYRGASRQLAGLLRGPLPKAAAQRVALVDALCDIEAQRKALEQDQDFCARVLGAAWRGEKTDFAGLDAVAAWGECLRAAPLQAPIEPLLRLAASPEELARLRRALREAAAAANTELSTLFRLLDLDPASCAADRLEQIDLARLSARCAAMAQAPERYAAWARMARLDRQLSDAGVSELTLRLRTGELDAEAAMTELRYARAEQIWREVLEQRPSLKTLANENRHRLVELFTSLERQQLKDNVREILAGHLQQVPQGAMGEMKVIRGEIAKKRGHMALRQLFNRAGTAIQRIKPVLLMSPISIAQFLPPGSLAFDLLVIDEASQVRPEDALGAIARAQQIVVVGDKKQLPPSSFFDRLLADDTAEDEGEDSADDPLEGAAKVAEMESILTLCEARGLGGRMLQWHYRSRDPSLIRVSNKEFYRNELILPPSPLQQDPAYGLSLTRVNGVYDRGGKRDNRVEGEAIVARVAEHARERPTLSLGVVTFSSAQRNLITELLELQRRQDRVLDDFLREGQAEDLFVKNIENVQGDERDVILVSVGYGPSSAGGRLSSMSFGPVNGEGGERRLNVLFTRARVRCEVFCSFDPGDMDLSRTTREGPRILKRFLDYAVHGQLDESAPCGLEADSWFEEDVAEVIRGFGYLADPQVGSAGFRIDLGVRHPDRPGVYLLAVECDGASYHSALWARERDRLRQDVLEHLGWRFHRIWSTDWFYHRQAETERLRKALLTATEDAGQGLRIAGANRARPSSAAAPEEQDEPRSIEVPDVVQRQMPAYQRAEFRLQTAVEPHEAPLALRGDLVLRIVALEGPVHCEEIARRLAYAFGKEKAGRRIVAATSEALRHAQAHNADLLSEEDFWFTREQAARPPLRDRSGEDGATLKPANISLLEIREALRIAHEDNAGGDEAELLRAAARLLGFARLGPELQARLAGGLQLDSADTRSLQEQTDGA